MKKITPCLWFNFNAEEAVNFYLSIFESGQILDESRYGDAVPELEGKVLTMRFELEGQEFLALNAGPQFPFTEAISLFVDCESQEEVDHYWDKLSEGGTPGLKRNNTKRKKNHHNLVNTEFSICSENCTNNIQIQY